MISQVSNIQKMMSSMSNMINIPKKSLLSEMIEDNTISGEDQNGEAQ